MRVTRHATRVAGALALTLLAAACSLERADVVPPTAEDAERGGVLRVAIGRPGSIDPTNAYEPFGQLVVATMCDTLLEQDPETGELVGALADTWQVTDTGSKLVFRLRKDITFHDGSALTADDVVSTLTRLASEDYASFAQDVVSLIGGFLEVSGRIEAEPEERERLAGVRVVDARSFEVQLRPDGAQAPDGQMADYAAAFTHLATAPVPARLIRDDPDGLELQPLCAGPYRLNRPWKGGDTIRLVRAKDYVPSNPLHSAGGGGWFDEIEFHVYDTADDRVAAFRRGDVDVAGVLPAQLDGLPRALRQRLVSAPAPGIEFVGLPAGEGAALGTPAVRRSLSMAIDRQRIARKVYRGGAAPATAFLPATLGPEFAAPAPCDALPAVADRARARQEAGGALRGQAIRIAFNDEGLHRQLLRRVKADWEAAFPGLRVGLEPVSWQELRTRATSTSGLTSGFRMSWIPRYPGPDQYIGPLFTTASVGRSNWSRYSDRGFDTMLNRVARRSVDAEDRATAYADLAGELCDSMPLIPVVTQRSAWLVADELAVAHGPGVSHATGRPVLREYYWSTDG